MKQKMMSRFVLSPGRVCAPFVRNAALTATVLSAVFVSPASAEPFPAADPASVGVDAAALQGMRDVVRGIVDREETVGAELLVIKDGKTVLHEGFGLRDREEKLPMAPGGIFCIRSMTKPVIGTAVQMLIEDGKLGMDDPAAKWLPSFDNDKSRGITVRQLLTHTSGLTLSELIGHGFEEFTSVQDVANLSGKSGPEHPVGEFNYSDQGADTLTAIIGAVTGAPAERFIEERILTPLGMSDSACVLKKDDPRMSRVCSAYLGGPKAWSLFSCPSKNGGLFPYFLGSQGMYSTPQDYARLLELWANGGTVVGKHLLSEAAIARGLAPVSSRILADTELTGLELWYGQLWMLYVRAKQIDAKPDDVEAFGHNGSDGTYAWAFPRRGLMVLYFTQSRGESTGSKVERAMQKLLIEGDANWRPEQDGAATTARTDLGDYVGLYDAGEKGYRSILLLEGKLNLDVPGNYCGPLGPAKTGGRDSFALEASSAVKFTFERAEDGKVSALRLSGKKSEETWKRFVPAKDLPTIDSVMVALVKAHRPEQLQKAGTVRLKGTVEIEAKKIKGQVTMELKHPGLARITADFGTRTETTIVNNGRVWKLMTGQSAQPTRELLGGEREHILLMLPPGLYDDWRRGIDDLMVVRRLEKDETSRLAVRAVPREAFPSRRLIDEESGRVVAVQTCVAVPGLGTVGVSVKLSDFRPVGGDDGTVIAWRAEADFATPLIGKIVTQYETLETGIELGNELFEVGETQGGNHP